MTNDEFWQEKLDFDKENPHKGCVIDNHHYIIDDEDSKATYFRGFGGAKFRIKFNDGQIITTTNLWHQGEIPENWRDKFSPYQAIFLKN